MSEQLMFVTERFQYRPDMSILDMVEIWKEKLGIEIDNTLKTQFMVIQRPLQETYEFMKQLDPKSVPTDCRFFAMFISTLYSNPDRINMFYMNINLKTIEVMVPENCLYICLDTFICLDRSVTNGGELYSKNSMGVFSLGQYFFILP